MKKNWKKTIVLIAVPMLALMIAAGVYAYGRSCRNDECGSGCTDDTECGSGCTDDTECLPAGLSLGTCTSGDHAGKCPNGLLSSIWSNKTATGLDR